MFKEVADALSAKNFHDVKKPPRDRSYDSLKAVKQPESVAGQVSVYMVYMFLLGLIVYIGFFV